jgi:hypothetical protein
MARTKKSNETDDETLYRNVSPADTETESAETETDSGHADNDGSASATNPGDDHAPAEEVSVDEIMQQFSDNKQKRGRKKKETQPPPPMIPGALLVEVTDSVGVSIASLLDGFLSKKPIDAQLLSLREEQKEKLIPLADACVVELQKMIQLNPIGAFFGTFATMQLSNYLLLRMMFSRADKEQAKNEEGR